MFVVLKNVLNIQSKSTDSSSIHSFLEQPHISIRRNSLWHFTFTRRSANCIKKGVKAKSIFID